MGARSSHWHTGQSEERTEYDDHRWVDGLLVPHRLTIHVGGLRYQPASVPPVKAHERLGDASSLAGGDGRTPDGTADPVATGERG